MPKNMILMLSFLLLGSWFVLGEKKTPFEKVCIVIVVALFYVGLRWMGGATLQEIISPLVTR